MAGAKGNTSYVDPAAKQNILQREAARIVVPFSFKMVRDLRTSFRDSDGRETKKNTNLLEEGALPRSTGRWNLGKTVGGGVLRTHRFPFFGWKDQKEGASPRCLNRASRESPPPVRFPVGVLSKTTLILETLQMQLEESIPPLYSRWQR